MAGNNKEAYQKAMNQGHSAAWDQEWEQAARWYRAALDQFPNNPQALSSLGLALFEMQDFNAALDTYQKAIALAPEDPAAQEKIARLYERMGRLNEAIGASLQAAELHLKARSAEKAIDNWVRVVALQPENANVRNRLAAVCERTGRIDQAVSEYLSLASIYQRSGDLTKAFQLVEHAHKLAPDSQDARMALSMLRGNQLLPRPSRPTGSTGPVRMARVNEMKGKPTGEEGALNPIDEARQRAMVQLAGLLFEQADESAAAAPTRSRGLSALTRGLGISGENESSGRSRITLHLSQAIDSQTQGDDAQAIIELQHALNLGLKSPAASFDLGVLLKNSDPEQALPLLQQSVRHPDFAMASHLLSSQIYEKNDQWLEAATAALQALALGDSQLVTADQSEEMLNQYDALVDSLHAGDVPGLQSLCKSVADQLMRPGWRAYLSQAREHLPQQPEGSPPAAVAEIVLETRSGVVVESIAQVRRLAANGFLRSALEEALFALQNAPTYLPLHVMIGDLLLQDGHPHEAIQKFMAVAELYSVRGEVGRSVRMLRRVSQIDPANLSVRQRIIDLLVAQEKIEEALQEYTNLADLFYRLAEVDKARQLYLDALKVAQRSKENRTWGVNLLLKVADIDMQRLNLRQALRVFEQIRAIQPENNAVRTQIISLNFRLGQDQAGMKELDDYLNVLESSGRRVVAVMFLMELLADNPNRMDLRRRLADLYIRNGETAKAVEQLDTAADALLAAGKHYEAINLLETIITLDPPNVMEYKTALESLRRDLLRK